MTLPLVTIDPESGERILAMVLSRVDLPEPLDPTRPKVWPEAIAEAGRVVTYEVPGARLLHDSGAPVRICPHRTLDSLIATLADALIAPDPLASSELVTQWTWPVRAREYSRIVQDVVRSRAAATRGTCPSRSS